MTDSEMIELAQAYVALSNAHRADLIAPLFAVEAVYRSGAVGEHRGRDAIMRMMRGFFADYPDVHWRAANYSCDQRRVEFDFNLRATTQQGDVLERSGREVIVIDADGYIVELVVQVS